MNFSTMEAVLAFQSQLSSVMETVLKAAVCEITRLVEDSFLAEVAQSRQEAEALRQRLQWSESKRREQEGVRRLRCVECGKSGDDGDLIQGRSSGTDQGADVPSPLHHHVRRYEQDSDSSERQDTQPSSASLTEQLRNIQDEGQTSHLYGPQTGQEDITVRISQEGALCSAGASDDRDQMYKRVAQDRSSIEQGSGISEEGFLQAKPQSCEEGLSPLKAIKMKNELVDCVLIKQEEQTQCDCTKEPMSDVLHMREGLQKDDRAGINVLTVYTPQVPITQHMPTLPGSCSGAEEPSMQDRKQLQMSVSLVGPLHSSGLPDDLNSKNVSWTSFKIGDSDSDSDGLESSYEPRQDSEVQVVNNKDPWSVLLPSEGCSKMVSSLHCVSVKSEAELPNTVPVKEEVDMQALWRDQVQSEISPRQIGQSCSRRGIQLGSVFSLASPQDAIKSQRSLSGESLTVKERRQRIAKKLTGVSIAENTKHSDSEMLEKDGSFSSNEGFRASKSIPSNLAVCRREKPFLCRQCGKTFTRLKNLQAHLKQHSGVRPHSCTHCGRSFLYLSRLKVHLLSHTGERPFNCGQCGKSFLSSYDLKVHQRNHTGEKPYSCTQCGKGFTRLSILKEHRSIHTKEKFSCTQCGKRFTRLSNMKTHLRQHSIRNPYSCTQCGKSFQYFCRLQKHQKKSHDQQH